MAVLRISISWIVLLVLVVLLTNFVSNSPVESAARKHRALTARDDILRMVARNTATEFSGSSSKMSARSNQLRKRKPNNGKRYYNPTPNYHKRNNLK